MEPTLLDRSTTLHNIYSFFKYLYKSLKTAPFMWYQSCFETNMDDWAQAIQRFHVTFVFAPDQSYNRPYALTSRLHNNDAMLGVKTCRAARSCCAGRAHWRSASQSVRGPGLTRRYGMEGLALWLHAWRGCTWQCLVWPPTHGGALLWRHMHMVYREVGITSLACWTSALVQTCGFRFSWDTVSSEFTSLCSSWILQ